MKIAQIVPNWSVFKSDEAIGIKAVVRDLCLGLTKRGHAVTLFAPDHSTFPGIDIEHAGPSLRDQNISLFADSSVPAQREYAQRLIRRLAPFAVVHSHIEHVLLPFITQIVPPVVNTVHGAAFEKREEAVFRQYPDKIYIALSESARRALPYINFVHVVYNGIDVSLYPLVVMPQQPEYIGWMGRITPDKGTLEAIAAAELSNNTIVLVGLTQQNEAGYLKKVQAKSDGASVRLLSGLLGYEKHAFLGNARVFLFPIKWEEPFGLVMIEAMACGTPVIAYNRGSVPEIVKDGVTGFIVDPDDEDRPGKGSWVVKERGIEGLVEAIKRIGEIDRIACRRHVEQNFTTEQMVAGYERVYTNVIAGAS